MLYGIASVITSPNRKSHNRNYCNTTSTPQPSKYTLREKILQCTHQNIHSGKKQNMTCSSPGYYEVSATQITMYITAVLRGCTGDLSSLIESKLFCQWKFGGYSPPSDKLWQKAAGVTQLSPFSKGLQPRQARQGNWQNKIRQEEHFKAM